MPMRPFALSALFLAALVGCGVPTPPPGVSDGKVAKDDKGKPTDTKPTDAKKETPDPNKKPGDPKKDEDPAKLGLKITDTKVGTGAVAEPGDTCYMNYVGTLTNGTEFDSTTKKGSRPFSFPLGMGRVIKGWELGVKGMKVGGKRTLYVPAALAYGDKPPGDSIPPNADLKFDMELLDVLKLKDADTINRTTITPGTGPAAKAGDVVNIIYTGKLINGTVVDSTEKNGNKPLQFKLGADAVMAGLDLAVTGMKKGQKIKVRIPPALGLSPQQLMGSPVPPDSLLYFDITLVSIG